MKNRIVFCVFSVFFSLSIANLSGQEVKESPLTPLEKEINRGAAGPIDVGKRILWFDDQSYELISVGAGIQGVTIPMNGNPPAILDSFSPLVFSLNLFQAVLVNWEKDNGTWYPKQYHFSFWNPAIGFKAKADTKGSIDFGLTLVPYQISFENFSGGIGLATNIVRSNETIPSWEIIFPFSYQLKYSSYNGGVK